MKPSPIALALAPLSLLAALALAGPEDAPEPAKSDRTTQEMESGERRKHPMYDDRGALDWREKLARAQQLAKEQRKLIFIEYGRET